jgi:protein-S-isoprenylcysteine O-methyltransferase Ste14
MPRRKKNSFIGVLMVVFAILLILATLLKFDAVANVVDPNGKMNIQNIANDSFPILLGGLLLLIGLITVTSVWVSVAFIIVGTVLIFQRLYQIYQRNKKTTISDPQ